MLKHCLRLFRSFFFIGTSQNTAKVGFYDLFAQTTPIDSQNKHNIGGISYSGVYVKKLTVFYCWYNSGVAEKRKHECNSFWLPQFLFFFFLHTPTESNTVLHHFGHILNIIWRQISKKFLALFAIRNPVI